RIIRALVSLGKSQRQAPAQRGLVIAEGAMTVRVSKRAAIAPRGPSPRPAPVAPRPGPFPCSRRRVRMKARQLIENSSFGPDEVKAMAQALDDAWAEIAPGVDNRLEAIQAARFAIADIILSLGGQGNFDKVWPARTAVQLTTSRSLRSRA